MGFTLLDNIPLDSEHLTGQEHLTGFTIKERLRSLSLHPLASFNDSFYPTASRKFFPGLNLGTSLAGILILALV